MIEKHEVEIPERIEVRDKAVICDFCGKRNEGGYWSYHFGVDWGRGHQLAIVAVQCRTGSEYPEGGSGITYAVDMCPECFNEKLVPWLESQKVQIQEREWDW